MTYYVYILTNSSGVAMYIGVTNDLIRRIYEHKQHLDPNSFTAKYDISKLVYYEATTDVYSALEREKQLKRWRRSKKNWLVETMNPGWEDLYPSVIE